MFEAKKCPARTGAGGGCGCVLACREQSERRRALGWRLDEIATFETLVAALRVLRSPGATEEHRRQARERLAASVLVLKLDDPALALERAELKLAALREDAAAEMVRLFPRELSELARRALATRATAAEMAAQDARARAEEAAADAAAAGDHAA